MSTKTKSRITTDRNEIKKWAEARGGRPAIVADTGNKSGDGVVRIKFAEENNLKTTSWDDFFETFENNNLAMLFQEETSEGETSRFHKIVSKDSQEVRDQME